MNMQREVPSGRGERRLLIVGGSADHLGGVEAFCARSADALTARGGWRIEHIAAGTAYLTMSRLPAFFRQLRRVFARRRTVDILWLQYVNLPDLAYLLIARMAGMRVLVTPHLGSNWRSQDNPHLRGLSERTLRLAHRLALISPTQEAEISLPASVPRSMIRNFLPADVLGQALPAQDALPATLRIIHSSRLSEGKGTFLVVELCARLRAAGVPFHARITGTGDKATMARLDAMIREHGLQGSVEVPGRVPEEELLAYLRDSDLLVHLSRIDSYPLIVLEALASSTAPVVMELAGARDMVETYGGHVVSTARPVDEVAAWLATVDLEALRRAARSAAERVRSDYRWDRCGAMLDDALRASLTG